MNNRKLITILVHAFVGWALKFLIWPNSFRTRKPPSNQRVLEPIFRGFKPQRHQFIP